jgi:hypothetical protein
MRHLRGGVTPQKTEQSVELLSLAFRVGPQELDPE